MAKLKSKTSINKFLYALIFIVLFLLSLNMIESGVAFADTNNLKFDNTSILDDLYNSTDEAGNVFDINNYPADKNGSLRVHSFVEYGYPYGDNQKNYALYLYIYNPQQLDLSQYADAHRARIGTAYNDAGEAVVYGNFKLRLVAKTTGEYNNLFYKFKVFDSDTHYLTAKLCSNKFGCRYYSIAGVYLKTTNEETLPITIAHTYKCSGYMAGYGKNADARSTFECKAEALEVLDFPVYQTSYLTGVSDAGAYHHNNVSSVYFAIPDRIFDEYGYLAEIYAQWYECKSAPIIVTSNEEFYKKLLSHNHYKLSSNAGKTVNLYDKNIDYALYFGYTWHSTEIAYRESYEWAYNIRPESTNLVLQSSTRTVNSSNNILPLVFYSPSYTDSGAFNVINKQTVAGNISSSTLKDYVINYKSNNNVKWHPDRELPAELFVNEVDKVRADKGIKVGLNQVRTNLGDTFDLNSFNDKYSSWWDKLTQYGWTYPRDKELDENHKNVLPFEEINYEKLYSQNLATELLINENDVDSFSKFCKQALRNNQKPYVFRFAVSDYYSRPATMLTEGVPIMRDTNSYYAQETMFFDFNIITMSFNKNEAYYTLAVMHKPLDVIAGVEAPPAELNPGEQIADKTLTFFENIGKWFKANKDKIFDALTITAIVIACLIVLIITICILKSMRKTYSSPGNTSPKPTPTRQIKKRKRNTGKAKKQSKKRRKRK